MLKKYFRKNNNYQYDYYEYLCNQEKQDINNAVATLKRAKETNLKDLKEKYRDYIK